MSGHSKWSTIKHKKGAADAKRGKLFSKFIKEITIAARLGGGDPDANPRLRTVVDKAKTVNMPSDNITRAIKKGTGELEGQSYEEISFEGYGPAGVAILIETLTDNRNRTVAEMRFLLSKMGGNLGENGCVSWIFSKKGVLTFEHSVGEDKIMDATLEAGADDIDNDGESITVTTDPSNFEKVKKICDEKGLKYIEAEVTMVPQNTIKLDRDQAEKMLKLMNAIEDHDDVQNVYANFDIDTEILKELA